MLNKTLLDLGYNQILKNRWEKVVDSLAYIVTYVGGILIVTVEDKDKKKYNVLARNELKKIKGVIERNGNRNKKSR